MRNESNPSGFRREVSCSVAFLLLLAAIVLPSSLAHAEVWENVTVVSKTEGEHFNVTVESVAGDSTSIIVNDKGSRKMLSFSAISVILDQRGKDITAQVFPWLKASNEGASIQDSAAVDQSPADPLTPQLIAPRASKTTLSSELVEMPRQEEASSERRFIAMFSAGAGYGVPAGDWFDGLTAGFSGGGTIRFGMSDNVFLGISYRRQQLGIEEDYKQFCIEDDLGSDCLPIDWDIHLDEFYLVLGYMSRVSTPRSPFVYVDFGLGAVKHVIKVSASVGEEAASAESDETELGVLLDIGGVFPLTREIGLNIEGDTRVTGKDFFPIRSPEDPSGPAGALFACKIGIVVMLGGGQ